MSEPEQNRGKVSGKDNVPGYIGLSEKFAALNKLTLRDANRYRSTQRKFWKFDKDDIQLYLSDPEKYEKQLREAVIYIYGASSHFRRIVQYFVGLTDLSYVVEPYRIDPKKANTKTVSNNYRKVLNALSAMSIKTQFPKVLTVCFREDVFYGTMWVTSDDITIQQLPSDYCKITTIEGGVFNVTFDFVYFDTHPEMLPFYPQEFRDKYEAYRANRSYHWVELDSPTSFAVKCNDDNPGYAMPPFAGLLRELYDIESYKQLKEAQTALENYAMVAMTIPLDDDGNWGIDLDKAKEFWSNLDSVLPDEIGSVLTPMDLTKISFEKSNTGDTDTVTEAEQHLFSAAGVSSLLFNNEEASANALLLSIKTDQSLTYALVKQIQNVINRYIHSQNYGKYFKVNFLDVSTYNRKDMGDAYLKAAAYGIPTISYYAASQGMGQAELDCMSFLETEIMGLQDMFVPLVNSAQVSSDDLESEAATDEGGAPKKDIGEVSDQREINSESE